MESKKNKRLIFDEKHVYDENFENELYLAHTNISSIPMATICSIHNLTNLNLACNNISHIGYKIGYLTNLQFLNLRHNKIRKVQKLIKNLTNLEYLSLENNYISIVPSELSSLCKLQTLDLSKNNISEIPEEFKNLTNLRSLLLQKNNFSIISPSICHITSLLRLDLQYNDIRVITNDLFKLTNLNYLLLSNNNITELSSEIEKLINLEYLTLTDNLLKMLPVTIGKIKKIAFLNISNNNIKIIPPEIINCRRMRTFYYHNNEIDYMSPQIVRFLDRLKNPEIFEIYNDNQNIHNHSIQSSITESISKITNQPLKTNEEIIMNQILNDHILNTKTKELLVEYSNNDDYHSVLLITFKELLLHVWEIIEANCHKDEIKSILNNEILDSECKCFTGRLSRLVNCLNGFSNLIEIKISDNQQIGNIIVIIRNDLISQNSYSIEEHKKRVIEELKTRGYDDVVINEWIEEIE
jgi:Leucine-rich repeat (LRR) protein